MSTRGLILLCAASIAFCQSQGYYESQMSARTAFFAGGVLALGTGMNPGVSACLEPIKRINTYFGAGGHVDYTWLSAAGLPADVGIDLHIVDISFVPKALWPVGKDKCLTFEIDPGWYLILIKVHDVNYHATGFNKRFGLTVAPGFTIGDFSFSFKVKSVFTDGAGTNDISLVNWIVLCAGINL